MKVNHNPEAAKSTIGVGQKDNRSNMVTSGSVITNHKITGNPTVSEPQAVKNTVNKPKLNMIEPDWSHH